MELLSTQRSAGETSCGELREASAKMARQITILVTSAGRRVGLIERFRAAALRLGRELRVVACDLQPAMSAACQRADAAVQVPRCTDPDYVPAVLEIVEEHQVDLIVPTIDPELLPLSQASAAFADAGAAVHVSPPEVIEVVRDKARTSEVLASTGTPVPRSVRRADLLAAPETWDWPVFAKPVAGSSSRGLTVIGSVEEMPGDFPEEMVFQEYLQGPEYTVNLFIDQAGQLRCVIPHRRLQIRAGEVEKGRTVRDPRFQRIAEAVAAALPGARGALCFQLIDDPDRGARVFEVNARFGGGYPLADQAGAPFAQWLLEEMTGQVCSASNDWREGVEMLRYDAEVFRG